MKTKYRNVLVIGKFNTDFSFSHYGLMNGFIQHESDNPKEQFSWHYGDPVTKLGLHAQADERTSEQCGGWYGMEISAGDTRMTLPDCEQMVKTLRPIHAKLDRMYADQGAVTSIGEWCARVAIAINATSIFVYSDQYMQRTGYRYHEFKRNDPLHNFSAAISLINRKADECRKIVLDHADASIKQAA